MKSPAEIHNCLVSGLVGTNVKLYKTNAMFKTAVDTLAKMLPIWIEGIAACAEEGQKVLDAYKEHDKLIANPFPGLGDDGTK